MTPLYAVREQVPEKALADEREIAKAKAVAAGKPEAVAEKMVEGMIGKWFGEVVLVDQAFVKDDSKKVSQVVAERAGKDARVVRFVRFKVGEGIEKKQIRPRCRGRRALEVARTSRWAPRRGGRSTAGSS